MKFTDKIAKYIQDNQLDYNNLTIILPSERAKKYVASSIFELHKKPVLAPTMITMDAWIRSHTKKAVIDKTRLLIKLFEIQSESATSNEDKSFDEFLEWGPILLSDFDELDRYLVDANDVFKDLHNIKELEYWKIDSEEDFVVSDARKRFLEFWERLPDYYQKLNEKIDKEGNVYMGLAYRYLAENIGVLFEENKQAHFIFAGFNALSHAETSIMRQLHKMGRGHVLIDADKFYLKTGHEAGEFIQKQIKSLDVKELPFIDNNLLEKERKIEVVECAQLTGQIKVAATRLMEMSEHEINQTLLLLADESLIGPLLRNIPKNVGRTNITLGMPMKGTAVKNWVDILFSIQESHQRFSTSSIYHNDLKRLLNHPFFIANATTEEKNAIQQLEEIIIKRNWIFISSKSIQLGQRLQAIVDLINTDWKKDWKIAMQSIRALNRVLYADFTSENQFERALIHSFDSALIDFHNIVNEGLPMMSLRSFKMLFTQHWSNKGIAYHGNPIEGLQVMGLLETRLLDFKNIICLGMNEGVMPPTNPIQSMFPMDLRRYAGLPLPRDKQGLFAHHFYRLIHNCENMLVTYSGTKESIGSNEKSRYLLQIEKELVRESNTSWEFKYYNVPMENSVHVDLRSIKKNDEILARMDSLFTRSTSISTLNKYHACSLDFYYRYVLEFGEEDIVEEELESSTFGTIVHTTLEDLYIQHAKYDKQGNINPEGGKPLRVSDIEEMLLRFNEILTNYFIKHFNGDANAFMYGKNYLSYTMAKKMVRDFLFQEKKLVAQSTVIIHSLEKSIKLPFEVNVNGEKKTFTLNGMIDRVDEVDGKIRLIDYKTGGCTDDDVRLKRIIKKDEKLTDFHQMKRNMNVKYLMQLLMYCYLYYNTEKKIPDTVGILSMMRIKSGLCEMNLLDNSIMDMIEVFPGWLQGLFEEIYDKEMPFEHTKKFPNYCSYCN